jgi:hypothetical protein
MGTCLLKPPPVVATLSSPKAKDVQKEKAKTKPTKAKVVVKDKNALAINVTTILPLPVNLCRHSSQRS